MKAGAADYLIKDQIDSANLERSIRYALENFRNLEALRESQRFLRSTIDALSAHIAILDNSGVIIEVNRAWHKYAKENHFLSFLCHKGDNYLDACNQNMAKNPKYCMAVIRGINAVINNNREEFTFEYSQ